MQGNALRRRNSNLIKTEGKSFNNISHLSFVRKSARKEAKRGQIVESRPLPSSALQRKNTKSILDLTTAATMSSSMVYLENYLDSLESLPGDLRRNFTLMHDLDTKNRDTLREVDAASDDYLRKVRELSGQDRKREMEKIQAMFAKAKNFGDDKVAIAIQTYELVDKHIRRLDSDLAKFEAEMKEKGRLSQTETEEEEEDEEEDRPKEKKRKKKGEKVSSAPSASSSAGGARGRKGEAEAAAKSKKGKKKGSGAGVTPGAAGSSVAAGASSTSSAAGGMGNTMYSSTGGVIPLPPGMLPVPQEVLDMPVDPNEPTYCLCQQVSYGEMIGCDNNDCPIEWFHFGCMGLTTKPKGKWYCPKCVGLFKKKK